MNQNETEIVVSKKTKTKRVRVVGVGASAGGLQALEDFFDNLSNDSGLSFVVVQHLSPDFKSVMDELLARHTDMKISVVEDQVLIEENVVYLIPPKTQMIVSEGKLLLTDQDEEVMKLPIDTFLRSLAQDQGEDAIGVILSGTGADGSVGLAVIKGMGGLTYIQDPDLAAFDGMPRSAMNRVKPDGLGAAGEIAKLIISDVRKRIEDRPEGDLEVNPINDVFKMLEEHCGIDFALYKPGTIERRIERRLEMSDTANVEGYLEFIRKNEGEIDKLYKDLLIGVTQFFRDEEAFAALKEVALPEIFSNTPETEEIRIWVCGCATGEEAYTIAILAKEVAAEMKLTHSIRVFATDAHRISLEVAGAGRYKGDSIKRIPETYRMKYFAQDGDYFKILPAIRQMVVFSMQNVIKDPPFTKLHLVSCRNMLIYFKENAQKHVIGLFHFALKMKGLLFLGNSEALNYLNHEFEGIDHGSRIFRKKRDGVVSPQFKSPLRPSSLKKRVFLPPSPVASVVNSPMDKRLLKVYDAVLGLHMAPGVLVNADRELLHVFGDAGRFFGLVSGRPKSDLLSMLEGDLKIAVTAALHKALREKKKCSYLNVITITGKDFREKINVNVEPLLSEEGPSSLCFLVTFSPSLEQKETVDETALFDANSVSRERVDELEHELRFTKEHLQTTIEELETSNEELQASNEEMLASNEELQSTNEELHSVNEELYTVNAEYERKNNELTEVNSDMDNLLLSLGFGTLFIDKNMCIRKFTPAMMETFRLMPQDIGRPIQHISHLFDGEFDLLEEIESVVSTRKPMEMKMESRSGYVHMIRISPYYAANNETAGVVVTDIDMSNFLSET